MARPSRTTARAFVVWFRVSATEPPAGMSWAGRASRLDAGCPLALAEELLAFRRLVLTGRPVPSQAE
jgi:hypothetical protein